MFKEFKAFIMRGNVLDLAVGIIIGAAFTGIVQSLVKDIIMPPIGLLLGKVDFSGLFLSLDGQAYASLAIAQEANAPTLNYGLFINAIINFLIVAFAIFMIIRWFNRMSEPKPAPVVASEPTTKNCSYCFTEIHIKATRCPHCTSEL
jgi:large conductance mechanosensitive channel